MSATVALSNALSCFPMIYGFIFSETIFAACFAFAAYSITAAYLASILLDDTGLFDGTGVVDIDPCVAAANGPGRGVTGTDAGLLTAGDRDVVTCTDAGLLTAADWGVPIGTGAGLLTAADWGAPTGTNAGLLTADARGAATGTNAGLLTTGDRGAATGTDASLLTTGERGAAPGTDVLVAGDPATFFVGSADDPSDVVTPAPVASLAFFPHPSHITIPMTITTAMNGLTYGVRYFLLILCNDFIIYDLYDLLQ